MTSRVVDIILAAGRGSRVGGTKGALDIGGRPLIARLLDEVLASTVDGVIVVLGHQAELVEPHTTRPRVVAVTNHHYDQGQLSSLQCGLRALPEDAGAFLVHPVDHCLVTHADLDALVHAFRERGEPAALIARPTFAGGWGHPVLYSRQFAEEFLALSPDASGRVVYRRHMPQVVGVEVTSDATLFDLDTTDDLAEVRHRLKHQARRANREIR